ncbi:sulfotransferase 2B1-like [Xenopus laevis]|uniref:Sulfotransferase n=1 Tax=Xenopus laevis TaxID=8355 RepID=A0A8J1L7R9_XENLA|nr:sulfotransferase 2B1-like [Xenopus laevis]
MSFDNFTYKGATFCVSVHSEEILKKVEDEFQVLDDDIFNITYPKSGTHWMSEILNLIKQNGDPTFVNSVPMWSRSPWYETIAGYDEAEKLTSPRIISSHIPYHIFSKSFFKSKAKVVYTMRNPKDVIVSMFYFSKILKLFKEPESFEAELENFFQSNGMYGSWFDHVKGWMQMAGKDNFFYITYEELQQDLRGSVVRICKFLGKELNDEEIDSVVKYSSFKVMKENKMSNFTQIPDDVLDKSRGTFMRKGVSGDWKNHFTVAQSEKFDKDYQENMKDLNIKFFWQET